jgi:hypothetical protein
MKISTLRLDLDDSAQVYGCQHNLEPKASRVHRVDLRYGMYADPFPGQPDPTRTRLHHPPRQENFLFADDQIVEHTIIRTTPAGLIGPGETWSLATDRPPFVRAVFPNQRPEPSWHPSAVEMPSVESLLWRPNDTRPARPGPISEERVRAVKLAIETYVITATSSTFRLHSITFSSPRVLRSISSRIRQYIEP